MQLTFMFKNLRPTENLKAYVEKRLKKLEKLFGKPAEARIVLTVEKENHIAEINLSSSNINILASDSSENMNASIDRAIDKLKVQVNKIRNKLQSHRSKHKNLDDPYFESFAGAT